MPFRPWPPAACWQHGEGRSGFEVAWFQAVAGGWVVDGTTAAVEEGQTWVVTYRVELDSGWLTRRARIGTRTTAGSHEIQLEADGTGSWLVNGVPAPALEGCLDVDLEASAMTNTLPVHRLGLEVGGRAAAPAAYVRALDRAVERLDQTYQRTTDHDGHQRYDYGAPAFGFTSRLVYDDSGLILHYPGIARRAR